MIPLTPCQHCVLVVTTPPAVCACRCNPSEGLSAATLARVCQLSILPFCRRQMKRLYSECSQEEDPMQLLTPEELAAQQAQVCLLLDAMAACQNMLALVTNSCDIHKQTSTKKS